MKKKTYQLGVRMDEDLLARLRRFEERTDISSSALVRASLESALDYFERENEIAFPLACLPKKALKNPPPIKHPLIQFRLTAGTNSSRKPIKCSREPQKLSKFCLCSQLKISAIGTSKNY